MGGGGVSSGVGGTVRVGLALALFHVLVLLLVLATVAATVLSLAARVVEISGMCLILGKGKELLFWACAADLLYFLPMDAVRLPVRLQNELRCQGFRFYHKV